MAVDFMRDPDALAAAAAAFLDAPPPDGPGREAEEMLRRAIKPLFPDLFLLDRALQEQKDFSIAAHFGPALVEKLAGLLFFTRYCMRFVSLNSGQMLDLNDMRHLLTTCMQTLYQVEAIDGLIFLYDYAYSQAGGDNPQFWDGVCMHVLYMLARLPSGRAQALAFLHERAHARRHVERIVSLPDDQRAPTMRVLGEEYIRARREGNPLEMPRPAPYVAMLLQFSATPPGEAEASFVGLMVARERIRLAVEASDTALLARWVAEGTIPAAQTARRAAMNNLATPQYVGTLSEVVRHPTAGALRVAAAIQELARLNEAAGMTGGDPNIIPLLREAAMTDIPDRAGAARLAARAFAAVDNFNESLGLVEHAVMVEVGEEALLHLRDTRRLALVERTIAHRSFLQPAYEMAFSHVQKAKSLMESVWSAQSEDLAMMYLHRLKEMKAYPELQTLTQKRTKISDLAQKTLAELKLSMSAYREE